MVEETPEALAERIRQQVDAALTRRLENPACLAPASLIRILYPVIEKHLTAGLLLDEIASALQEEGYKVTKGHLVRHLGTIREERGLPPLRRGKRTKGGEVEGQGSGQPRAAARPAPVAAATNIPASAPAPVAPVEQPNTAAETPSEATLIPKHDSDPERLPDESLIDYASRVTRLRSIRRAASGEQKPEMRRPDPADQWPEC